MHIHKLHSYPASYRNLVTFKNDICQKMFFCIIYYPTIYFVHWQVKMSFSFITEMTIIDSEAVLDSFFSFIYFLMIAYNKSVVMITLEINYQALYFAHIFDSFNHRSYALPTQNVTVWFLVWRTICISRNRLPFDYDTSIKAK